MKLRFGILCFLLISISLYSTDFKIGAYSQYETLAEDLDLPQSEIAQDISQAMSNANITHCVSVTGSDDNGVYYDDPFIFLNNGVQPLVSDYYIALGSIFTDIEFQPEFFREETPKVTLPTDWPKEMKWYRNSASMLSNSNVRSSLNLPSGNCTKASSDTTSIQYVEAGYIMDKLVSPWIVEGDTLNLKAQVMAYGHANLSFKLRARNFENGEVLRLGAKILFMDKDTEEITEYRFVPLENVSGDNYNYTRIDNEIIIDSTDYNNLFDYNTDFVTLNFKTAPFSTIITYADTTFNEDIYKEHWGRKLCLYPTIYYSQNGILEVDEVNIKGSMQPNIAQITNRRNYYLSRGINTFSGSDEPIESSFRNHSKVLDILQEGDSEAQYIQSISKGFHAFDARITTNPTRHIGADAFMYLGNIENSVTQEYPCNTWRSNNWTEAPSVNIIDKDSQLIPGNIDVLYETLQGALSIMVEDYREEKLRTLKYDRDINFTPAIQSYGSLRFDASATGENRFRWIALQPPSRTQQVLAYLPFCYGANGIYYYNFSTFKYADAIDVPENYLTIGIPHTENSYIDERDTGDSFQRSLVNRYTANDNWDYTPQYSAVRNVNAELKVIGPMLNELNWNSEKTKTITSDENGFLAANLQNSDFASVAVFAWDPTGLNNHQEYDEGYDGFVECSIYDDGDTDYFLLVNRRANFPKNDILTSGKLNGYKIDDNYTDLSFHEADPQNVELDFASYQGNYVLRDMYTGDIFDPFSPLAIGPGEAKLLKLTEVIPQTLPQGITELNNEVLQQSIIVPAGATLKLKGINSLKSNASITVQEGGFLDISASHIRFSDASKIIIEGNANIHDSVFKCFGENVQNTDFFELKENSDVAIYSCEFENSGKAIVAKQGELITGNLIFSNCDTAIEIPDSNMTVNITNVNFNLNNIGQKGIDISGNNNILNVISATFTLNADRCIGINNEPTDGYNSIFLDGSNEKNIKFVSTNNFQSTIGIRNLYSENSEIVNFSCKNAIFDNLGSGISILSNYVTNDIIERCNFDNMNSGIKAIGCGRIDAIQDNSFSNCNIGVDTSILARIASNNFSDNGIGVFYSPINRQTRTSESGETGNNVIYHDGIFNCTFSGGTGILSLFSSPRIQDNHFTSELENAIQVADESNVNLNLNANNVFRSENRHLNFIGCSYDRFSSSADLHYGHNDFYEPAIDFYFSDFFSNAFLDINARGNYWQNDSCALEFGPNLDPRDYPSVDHSDKDADPNEIEILPAVSRYDIGCIEMSNDNIEAGYTMFLAILYDRIKEEEKDWSKALDYSYELTIKLGYNVSQFITLLEELREDIPSFMKPEDYKDFQYLLDSYIKKCYVTEKEYQAAIQIAESKLMRAETTQDSIYAQMDIENIYIISSLDNSEGRSSVRIATDCYLPKTVNEFEASKANHLDRLFDLLENGDTNEPIASIPSVPTISGNYPNPFNPATSITFSIPEKSNVEISIYNIKGQKVKTLTNKEFEIGNHSVKWNGDNDSDQSVSSGVYFYRFNVNGKTKDIKKCLLLK